MRQTMTAEVRLDEGKPPSCRPAWPRVSPLWLSAGQSAIEFRCRGTPKDGRSRLNEPGIRRMSVKWTRLSSRSFAANAVRLQLQALAYNLANFMRTLAMPKTAQP